VVTDNHEDILARYKRMRQEARRLIAAMMTYLSREALEKAGKKLGLWVKGTLVFDGEEEMAMLMDCALFDIRVDGRNAVDRYAAAHPAPPGSDEEAVLEAKKGARFSIFQVQRPVWGVGIEVLDVLRVQNRILADVNLSYSIPYGAALASRVLDFGDFLMTTGAGFPVSPTVLDRAFAYLDDLGKTPESGAQLNAQEQSDLATHMLRWYLSDRHNGPRIRLGNATDTKEDALRNIAEAQQQRDMDDRYVSEPGDYVTAPITSDPRIGRNDPCPCGSGRKFKKCCGR
jgi:hypothetical protein